MREVWRASPTPSFQRAVSVVCTNLGLELPEPRFASLRSIAALWPLSSALGTPLGSLTNTFETRKRAEAVLSSALPRSTLPSPSRASRPTSTRPRQVCHNRPRSKPRTRVDIGPTTRAEATRPAGDNGVFKKLSGNPRRSKYQRREKAPA